MQPPQDHFSGSEPVYCSVMEFQTDTTDIIEMNNDNYPEAHKVFDSWDSRDHRRRPHLPSSSPPTATSHRQRRTLPYIGGPEQSIPYPTARGLNQVDPPAPGVLSNFPGAVEYPSPFRGYPQGAQSSSLQLVAPQYPQHGMDLGGSPTNFLTPAQNVAFADRPAWEQGSLFHSYDQPQPQPQSFLDNPPLSFSTSTQDNTLTLNQGGDFYGVEYTDNISYGGEPLQFYPEIIPWQYPGQESADHSSPPQISPPVEINDNLLNTTRDPYQEDWNQPQYQYPTQDSFY